MQPIAVLWASPTHCKSFIIHQGQFAKSHIAASLVVSWVKWEWVQGMSKHWIYWCLLKGTRKMPCFEFPQNWLSWQVKERSPYFCSLVDLHSWLSLSVILNRPSTDIKVSNNRVTMISINVSTKPTRWMVMMTKTIYLLSIPAYSVIPAQSLKTVQTRLYQS